MHFQVKNIFKKHFTSQHQTCILNNILIRIEMKKIDLSKKHF